MILLKTINLALAIACISSFAWARRNYFARAGLERRERSRIGPLGTAFSVLVGVLLILAFPADLSSVFGWLAVTMYVASLALFWSAVRAHGDKKPHIALTEGAPEGLVLHGPYKIVRHPFYSAYLLFWAATIPATGTVIAAMPSIVMGFLYWRIAKDEEGFISRSSLAGQYNEYSRRVGMFIPRMFPRRA